MTAELRRSLVLACVGLAGGFALVVALFGPGEVMKRARSVVTPAEAPRTPAENPGRTESPKTEAQPGPGEAAPEQQARGEAERTSPATEPAREAAREADKPSAEPPRAPGLDIVRVEPNGDAVIAGRGTPNATVEVLRDNKPIARAVADPSGQFAIVPPTLPTGSSELTIRTIGPDGTETRGKESVVVVVADNRTTKPLVAVSTPDKPTTVLSQPDAPADGKTAASDARTAEADKAQAEKPPQAVAALPEAGGKPTDKPAEAAPVKIVSVDAQENGRLDVTGRATAWSTLRLYLNDTLVASGQAGPDGRIAFTIGRGVKAGGYQIRVDQVEPKTGKVEHRAQVAFTMPESAAARVARNEPASPAATPQPAKPEAGGRPSGDLASRAPSASAEPQERADRPSGETAARTGTAGPAGKPPAVARSETPAGAEADRRTAPRTPPGAAAGKPDAARPETDRRTAEAPASDRPAARKPEAPARRAETPGAGVPASPSPALGATQDSAAGMAKNPITGAEAVASAPTPQPGTVFVAEISTAKISRGDSLWQISRRTYGSGVRYTVIYDANHEQIRDPDLIYPGQIFVLPKDAPGAKRG